VLDIGKYLGCDRYQSVPVLGHASGIFQSKGLFKRWYHRQSLSKGSLLHVNIGYHTPKALLISAKHVCVCPSRPFLKTEPTKGSDANKERIIFSPLSLKADYQVPSTLIVDKQMYFFACCSCVDSVME
jgi:hypothetical protein